MRETQNLLIAVGRRFVSEFLLFRGLFLLFFVFLLIELLFGRALASGCEAHRRLCVRIKEKLDFNYYKNLMFFESINYFAFAVLLSIFVPKHYKFEELHFFLARNFKRLTFFNYLLSQT